MKLRVIWCPLLFVAILEGYASYLHTRGNFDYPNTATFCIVAIKVAKTYAWTASISWNMFWFIIHGASAIIIAYAAWKAASAKQ